MTDLKLSGRQPRSLASLVDQREILLVVEGRRQVLQFQETRGDILATRGQDLDLVATEEDLVGCLEIVPQLVAYLLEHPVPCTDLERPIAGVAEQISDVDPSSVTTGAGEAVKRDLEPRTKISSGS